MKIKIQPYIDGKPQEIEATVFNAIRGEGRDIWYLVRSGERFWRVKKRDKAT